MTSPGLLAAAAGLALGLSLIVAIGAQNAFVLRQGLVGEHVVPVVAVCIASDLTLIVCGVAGAGILLSAAPWAIGVIRVAGAGFLLGYAALAARRSLRPRGTVALSVDAARAGRPGLARALVTCLAFTWLNPHVYLDTVILLGTLAAARGEGRWWFAAGACAASALWFTLLGTVASALRPVFGRPAAWRVLDGVIAATLAVLGVSLLLHT